MNADEKLALWEEREYKIYKANEIIQRAHDNLNLKELKTFAYILSKVKPTDLPEQWHTYTVADYCRICGIDGTSGKNYLSTKMAFKKLRDTSFYMTLEDGTEQTVGFLASARARKRDGTIRVKLDPIVEKYIFAVQKNFTQYAFINAIPMKSSYSFRLYELLKSYEWKGVIELSIEELKIKLGATNYTIYGNLKNRVIEVAVKEINLHTDLQVSWRVGSKEGRKVASLIFEIEEKETFDRLGTYIKTNEMLDANLGVEPSEDEQIEGQTNIFDFLPDPNEPKYREVKED